MTAPRALAEIARDTRAVVAAGRALADRVDASFVRSIAASAGLSEAGVRLALSECLESPPSDTDVRRIARRVSPAAKVTVVLAANVFVASLRAVALALAAAPRVDVSPSRRDPAFAERLVEALADPRVRLVGRAERPIDAGVVHAYGRDATMRELAAATRAPVWAHGAGLAVAVVTEADDPAEAARLLVADVVPFDQRGCLSPRVVGFVGDERAANELAARIASGLAVARTKVPLGARSAAESREVAAARDVALVCGEVVGDEGAMVAVTPLEEGVSCMLLPPGRHLVVVPLEDEAALSRLLGGFGRSLVGVAAHDHALLDRVAPRWARRAGLGRLQRPPLDGPVDLRDVWILPPRATI